MNIAVIADVHGRVLLAFKLVARYQRETGEHVDLILQCGDMGLFPDLTKLDRATIRHARKESTELGFHDDFLTSRHDVRQVLESLDCNLVAVRGNHEDHEFLDGLERATDEAVFPVDCYKRIHVLKTGVPFRFEAGDENVTILGIGRVGPPVGETELNKPKYIQERETERILELDRAPIDVLVSHDSARDFFTSGFGMAEIRWVLDQCRPVYHFFGHSGRPFHSLTDTNGVTVCAKMSDFEWDEKDPGKPLKAGCLGILRWRNRQAHAFEVVSAPWLREYTAHTWRRLG
ncbi:MAG: metallophosphoesterase family protein [Kiritimatiellae bacterium]|nr:metallophosphoesterase family protein [Kiritimatiellia bacterium]